MTRIQAVVFDIGNVLIEWQPERFYDAEIGVDRRIAMFQAIDLHGMNDRVDRGENFRTVVYETAEKYPDWTSEIKLWHDRWLDMATPAIQPSVDLLRNLRRIGVPVFALSNFGIETFALAEEKYPFLREFDRRYISGHMSVIKPDPAIYQMLENDSGIAPDALLFADDREDNINAAKARGWHTHLFQSAQGWHDCVSEYGLIDA